MGITRTTCASPPPEGTPVPPTQSATAQAQWDLAGLGYLTFADVDGIPGPQTAAAAMAFQSDACIGVDGIIGPVTTAALTSKVRQVQKVAGTTQDGGYGPNTEQAVKNWQAAHHVSPVDGQAGAITMAAMGIPRVASCSSPPPPPNGNLGQAIASVAASELNNGSRNHEAGGYNCNYYTTAFGRGSTGCSNGWRSEEWCADFANWVWRQADAKTDGITAAAASFYAYGHSKGTWHTTGPQVGDAVAFDLNSSGTYASHVGLVTAVSGSSFTMISGNSYNPNDGQDDAVTRVTLPDSGGGVSGFTDPLSAAPPVAHSTNFDWARVVLQDGGWSSSTNNVTALTQWMDSEEPASNWWNRNNPLNNGLGSGGGAGLGSYNNLLTAAYYVAKNLREGSGYGAIVKDLAASATPSTTAAAIWDSPWSTSHYGYGQSWHSGSVPAISAPTSAW